MENSEDDLPGLVFWHHSARRYEVAGKQKGEVTLRADINDELVWDEVLKKFLEGFPVYTVEDFAGEMVNAYRSELKDAKERVVLLERQMEQMTRERALLEERLAKAQEPLAALGRRLGRT